MRTTLSVLSLMALGLLAWSCADEGDAPLTPGAALKLFRGEEAAYDYTARDSSAEVVRGILWIAVDDSGRIAGRWQLEQVRPTSSPIGPQTGEGELVGMIEEAEFWINLNPEYADNNVFLVGTSGDDGLKGVWQFLGFPGVLGRGTFEAHKSEG